MKNKTGKVVAFVPAKSSSERVKNKNMRILDGEHLFIFKLKQLLACEYIDEVWLDTDSQEMIDLASNLPIKILARDQKLANNATDGHELFVNECNHVPDADYIVQALCTAPFIDNIVIDRALQKLFDNSDFDSLVAVQASKQYTWSGDEPDYGYGRIPNSVDLQETTIEAMSLYIVKRTSKFFGKKRFGKKPFLFSITDRQAVDINYDDDLALAQDLFLARRVREQNYFGVLKYHLSSPIISDVSKELGYDFAVDPKIHEICKGKILGRAKTLKICGLEGDEKNILKSNAWTGIYDALKTYDFMLNGDVILVENEIKNRAYFGDLNAHLAIKTGVAGVIVDGVTRDTAAVEAMGLPVYASGRSGIDIKYEGKVEHFNLPIKIGGQIAKNGDIVFADSEGVFIIPEIYWVEVLDKILNTLTNENDIRNGIINGIDTSTLIEQHGFF